MKKHMKVITRKWRPRNKLIKSNDVRIKMKIGVECKKRNNGRLKREN